MKAMQKWMLGAAVVAGVMGLGTTTAQAAEFGVYAHGPAAYVHPAPERGYELRAGYRNYGYRVPERRIHAGVRDYHINRFEDRHFDRGWDHRSERMHDRNWVDRSYRR